MKKLHLIIFILIFSNVFSQPITEKNIKTEVSEVTVFIDGAQIVRKKTVELTQGESVIKFISLSPFIDSKSIQVKVEGEVTVLSVNHQQNFMDKLEKSKELQDLETKMENINDKIKMENTYLSIIYEELAFLKENRNIGGKNEQITVSNLQQTSEYFTKSLTSLKLKEIERNKTLENLNIQKDNIQNQIKTLTSKKDFPNGEISVKISSKEAINALFEVSYLVGNAGWYPSYDIRAKNVNEPIQIIYKANVKQDTKVGWENVKLKFSSSDPNVSGVIPELKAYYLNYNSIPPTYKQSLNNVSGKVVGSDGLSLPGANVIVEGTTIGTSTDIDGNYSITIPNNAGQLTYSFIGYISQTLPILNSTINVRLEEDVAVLEETVVVAYGISNNDYNDLEGKTTGVSINKPEKKIRGTNSLTIPTIQVENQTTVDFEIKTPYSVKSDNKSYSVDMEYYDLPAIYQYYCIPKIDKDAFLIANIVDWEKYNLLEGETNIFFEDTYIGKTLLDVRYATDTLQISLGRDKNVSVHREKLKDFTNKQFFGNKKEETRAWKTVVRNNKNQTINMIILDQVPISTLDEIEVNLQNISGANHNSETGEIKWEFSLEPNNKKELELKYSVKYPKFRKLIIE